MTAAQDMLKSVTDLVPCIINNRSDKASKDNESFTQD